MPTPEYPHPFHEMYRRQVALFKRMPLRVSQWALLEMKLNFKREGYYDEAGMFHPWKARKKSWGKDDDVGRALLIKTRRLSRSLRAWPVYYTARVITDVPYAAVHQSGFKGTIMQRVKAFNRRKMGKFGVIKTTSQKKSTAIKFGKAQVGQIPVKAHSRKIKVDIPARPFMTVGKHFYDNTERKILTELEQLFLKS